MVQQYFTYILIFLGKIRYYNNMLEHLVPLLNLKVAKSGQMWPKTYRKSLNDFSVKSSLKCLPVESFFVKLNYK